MVSPEVARLDREQLQKDLAACENQFHAAMRGIAGETEWRSEIASASLAAMIARQARAADLVITAPALPWSALESNTSVNAAALALRAGRPVLVVPRNLASFATRNILVAWKDGREARHAVADALPLLLDAEAVTVLEVADLDDLKPVQTRVEDVARWLARHGVRAVAEAVAANTGESHVLASEIERRAPDLLVAGAYGHSRMNEWVFGGVTREILLGAGCCVLLSH
jgi:nucleotide-binding universal stress UspA family protein